MAKNSVQSPQSLWLYNSKVDSLFILFPPFFAIALAFFFAHSLGSQADTPPVLWIILVIGIDVAHVYSTLYRTYFDTEEFQKRFFLFLIIPTACWLVGVMLYSLSAMIFWRVLAYLAVYHFVRQQYGMFMLYRGKMPSAFSINWWSRIDLGFDRMAIYYATLYPLIYWHLSPGRFFSWFLPGDFFSFADSQNILAVTAFIYFTIAAFYIIREIIGYIKFRQINIGKNLVYFGTLFSWYVGIVLFNGDLIFTLTNVVCHGIPYIALIWIYGRKKSLKSTQLSISKIFLPRLLPLFLALLFFFAYIEEFFWDTLIWRDHCDVFFNCFSSFLHLEQVTNNNVLKLLVPLLAVPQATHYVLDAFIWRINKGQHTITEVLR